MKISGFAGLFAAALLASACQQPAPEMKADETPSLKRAFEGQFLVGAALCDDQFCGRNERDAALVVKHFNSITSEDVLKWENVHPEPDRYDFDASDRLVAFGEVHGMTVIGHTLVWHNQTPGWVFEDDEGNPLDREALLARMRDHIFTVVGRYKGRIAGWDVVNEGLNDDGTLRQSPWMEIIGEDYIAKAFEYAHEADPDAGLYYNDYSLVNEAKRNGAVALIQQLKAEGVPVTGVGLQGHYNLIWPTAERLDSTLTAFGQLGIDVMITEADMDVLPSSSEYQDAEVTRREELRDGLNPYTEGLPDSIESIQVQQWASLFKVFVKHSDDLTRVTFWGVTDANSWKNNWPIRGRTNYCLLFDRDGNPKPAFDAVIATAKQ